MRTPLTYGVDDLRLVSMQISQPDDDSYIGSHCGDLVCGVEHLVAMYLWLWCGERQNQLQSSVYSAYISHILAWCEENLSWNEMKAYVGSLT